MREIHSRFGSYFVNHYLWVGSEEQARLREHLTGCELCKENLEWWFSKYREGEQLPSGAELPTGIAGPMEFLAALDQRDRQRKDVEAYDIESLFAFLNSPEGRGVAGNLLDSIRALFQGPTMPWYELPYIWGGN